MLPSDDPFRPLEASGLARAEVHAGDVLVAGHEQDATFAASAMPLAPGTASSGSSSRSSVSLRVACITAPVEVFVA
jgi:hypothetical protein